MIQKRKRLSRREKENKEDAIFQTARKKPSVVQEWAKFLIPQLAVLIVVSAIVRLLLLASGVLIPGSPSLSPTSDNDNIVICGPQTSAACSRDVTRVPIIAWPSQQSPANWSWRALAEAAEPVVVRGAPLTTKQWQVNQKWTAEYLRVLLSKLEVYTQEERSFATFHDGKPLEPLLVNRNWSDFNLMSNLSFDAVLPAAGREVDMDERERKKWHYFTSDMRLLGVAGQKLMADMEPLDPFLLAGAGHETFAVNLWLGRAGLITHSHYDAQYNFFLQVSGKKRFTLFPPSPRLSLFPALHPHYAHLQPAPSVLPLPASFPPGGQGTSTTDQDLQWVAELTAGDVLVVPKFWLHHVETVENSIAVNVWSDAPEYDIMNQLYESPIPFEEDWPKDKLALASHAYLSFILSRHVPDSLVPAVPVFDLSDSLEGTSAQDPDDTGRLARVREYVRVWLLRARYQPLVDRGEIRATDAADTAAFYRNLTDGAAGLCARPFDQIITLGHAEFGGKELRAFENGFNNVNPLFQKLFQLPDQSLSLPARTVSPDMKRRIQEAIALMLMGNYVEHFLKLMLSPAAVYPFLKLCF
eukprot:g60212.t1